MKEQVGTGTEGQVGTGTEGQVGIAAISAYVPEGRLNVMDHLDDYGATADFVRNKTGALSLARRGAEQDTSDLAEAAIARLVENMPDYRQEIGMLIVVTQNPDGHGLPAVSSLLHGRLGLRNDVAAFDLSLGCSGWVYGLSMAKAFMEANAIALGLLVTADPYSKIIDPTDRDTALLFGDAATATLLSRNKSNWLPGHFVFGTDGSKADHLEVGEDGHLHMNGRGIFVFSAKEVPKCIAETLSRNRVTLDDIDRIVLHQGSRYIVDTIGERIGASERTPFLASDVGNTVSSTIPLILAGGYCAQDERVLVCGFGVGLSWAATILTKKVQ